MQYIVINENNIILHTSKGVQTVGVEHFNFNRILRLLTREVEEEDILPLLDMPEAPNGIFKAYYTGKEIIIDHYTNTASRLINLSGKKVLASEKQVAEYKLLGMYTKVRDIVEEWPELV